MSLASVNILFASSAEQLLNPFLRLDPESLIALEKLSGKVIKIELKGLHLQFYLLPDVEGLLIVSEYTGEVDAQITAPPVSLLRLLLEKELIIANVPDVHVTGDIGVAQRLANSLKQLDVDWEEQVARLIGDIPAHQLGSWLRSAQTYSNTQLQTVQQNLSEYLQEEVRYVPATAEAQQFLNDVDTLRDDVERLELRVRKLLARV